MSENEQIDPEELTEDAPPPPPEPSDDEQAEAEDEDERNERLAEPEQPEQRGPSPEEIEKRIDKTQKAFEAYTRRVSAIWEEEATAFLPFNLDPYAPPGFIDPRNAGRVDEDTKAAAMEFLGFAREQDYEPDPEARECPTCAGKGFTKLPTKVPGKEKRTCPTCKGLGYTGIAATHELTATNGHSDERFTLDTPEAAASQDADRWGQPRILPDGRENPNWGRTPDYWVAVPPWGTTQYLAADGTYQTPAASV